MTNATTAEPESRLGWHIGDNLRWLAAQSGRPGYTPCGMLTGEFLKVAAERFDTAAQENIEAADELARLRGEAAEMRKSLAAVVKYPGAREYLGTLIFDSCAKACSQGNRDA